MRSTDSNAGALRSMSGESEPYRRDEEAEHAERERPADSQVEHGPAKVSDDHTESRPDGCVDDGAPERDVPHERPRRDRRQHGTDAGAEQRRGVAEHRHRVKPMGAIGDGHEGERQHAEHGANDASDDDQAGGNSENTSNARNRQLPSEIRRHCLTGNTKPTAAPVPATTGTPHASPIQAIPSPKQSAGSQVLRSCTTYVVAQTR